MNRIGGKDRTIAFVLRIPEILSILFWFLCQP